MFYSSFAKRFNIVNSGLCPSECMFIYACMRVKRVALSYDEKKGGGIDQFQGRALSTAQHVHRLHETRVMRQTNAKPAG
jgi:hypothetical protein